MPFVLTQLNNRIGTITFNYAEKRNCLGQALIHEMLMALDEFEQDAARAVILRAAEGVTDPAAARTGFPGSRHRHD
jgi:enoyl-CoA hydratase/carnithine racemase